MPCRRGVFNTDGTVGTLVGEYSKLADTGSIVRNRDGLDELLSVKLQTVAITFEFSIDVESDLWFTRSGRYSKNDLQSLQLTTRRLTDLHFNCAMLQRVTLRVQDISQIVDRGARVGAVRLDGPLEAHTLILCRADS